MKIVFFGNDTEKIAAIRYRVIRFAEMLRKDGHRCVVCLPGSVGLKARLYDERGRLGKLLYLLLVLLRRTGQLRHVPTADVVYFRGPVFPYGPPIFEWLCRLGCKRLVFDIDDAVWEPPAHVDSFFVRFMDLKWVPRMARLCTHAVVGNAYLADHVRPMNPNITIIPTCIDMARHQPRNYTAEHAGPVVLGWTGLKDNLGYLKPIEPVLQALARRHDIVLSIATGKPYALEGVRVVNHGWRIEEEIDYLREADIGLMPLTDTPRARGKCAFKALQYMGVGVPAVLSPVGMNADVVEDGVTGFLADSPGRVEEKLERLIVDAALRRRMGEAARACVLKDYSHAAHYPRLRAMLEAL